MSSVNDRAAIAEFTFDVPSSTWTWSQGLYDLHGPNPAEQPTTDHLLRQMFSEDLPVVTRGLEYHLTHPGPFTCMHRMTDAAGRTRQIRVVGTAVRQGGDVIRLEGFVLDVTDDVRAWQAGAVGAALEHRAAIEQAKGALMLAFHIDDNDAFAMLRSFSNDHNEKLWAVAERLIDTFSDARYLDRDPVEMLRGHLDGDPGTADRPAPVPAVIH